MSTRNFNVLTIAGNIAAEPEIKSVTTRSGKETQVAEVTIYAEQPTRDESFRIRLSIWEGSSTWSVLPYLKTDSLITAIGPMGFSPYITSTDNSPRGRANGSGSHRAQHRE
ncbi:single-stranded DNA-binding protein [Almyronema epifaneia]|uniref:Single-stranded DNA-binding protein n=1 Tax=Almyronema epifaneia S1 TaxID=2991925 RepID=A0ABW6IBE3_9CYAN